MMNGELEIYLICTKKVEYGRSWYIDESKVFNEGDIVKGILNDTGIRLEYKEKHYGLPVKIRDISKCFKIK